MYPGCEISSLLDIKLVKWSTVSCPLALICRPSVSKHKNKNKNDEECKLFHNFIPCE